MSSKLSTCRKWSVIVHLTLILRPQIWFQDLLLHSSAGTIVTWVYIFIIFRKQKWDEDDFEGEMEEEYDDDMAEESLQMSRETITPGRGILLLPHRQLLTPHSQLMKARSGIEPEPRASSFPAQHSQGQQQGQDHTDWTYEEQFRQVQFNTLTFVFFFVRSFSNLP